MALLTGLVSYWKLDESSGNAADAHGSNTLTNNGSLSYIAGKINNAADFVNSSSQSLSITDASQSGLDPSGSFSINMWLKTDCDTPGHDDIFFSKHGGAGQISYFAGQSNGGGDYFFRISSDGTTQTQLNIASSYGAGSFKMLTCVFTASTRMEMFVNGSTVGNNTTSIPAAVHNSTAVFALGSYVNDAAGFLDGTIDEVGFWSKALSTDEITELYNSGSGLAYSSFASGPANLKTYNTNTSANIKTINTNAIANVKSLNTIT